MKAGFVGVIGLANAGKSTVVNQLVGEKVAIVSSKPQTTRKRVMGVLSSPEAQILFVDSPGLVENKTQGIHAFLHAECLDVIQQSDALLVILNVDAGSREELESIIKLAKDSGKPWIAVINKIDLPQTHRARLVRELLTDVKYFEYSAKQTDKVTEKEIVAALSEMLPESPQPLYDTDLWTLQNSRELAAEIVREKAFINLFQEIPFGLAVRILKYEDASTTANGITKIYGEIMVGKENHRPMVVGQGASMIKKIGQEARLELEKILGSRIYLELHVAVKKNWMKNPLILQELGYVVKEHTA